MRLGEALAYRAELQQKIGELGRRLNSSAIVQEGDTPIEDPDMLLEEVDSLTEALEKTVAAINVSNSTTLVAGYELTVTALLARRDALKARFRLLSGAVEAASQSNSLRYSRSEIRMVRVVNVSQLRARQDLTSQQLREIDVALQQSNWEVEVNEIER